MKVLVTGSSGFIGQHVRHELERRGNEVIALDKPDDVTDRMTWNHHRLDEAEAVINLAGMLGTPELFGSEATAVQVNVVGAMNAYDFARDRSIPLVQIGTGHKGQPNPYAITKACAEDLGLARAQWLGHKIAVVRAYHVYGPGQLPGYPYGPSTVQKFFPTFACSALTKQPLELCGGGGQVIDPVYVQDVARELIEAIGGPYGEVTEAGCGKPVTVRQIAENILTSVGGDWPRPRLEIAPERQGEPHDSTVLASAPACVHPWPFMMHETIDWYRKYLDTR